MRTKLFYFLPQIDRIGHVAIELFWLKNLFPPEQYDFHVVTPPPDKVTRLNRALFDIIMRGVTLLPSEDDNVLWAAFRSDLKGQIVDQSDGLYVLRDQNQIAFDFMQKTRHSKPTYYHQLSPDDLSRGEHLRKKFGIPLDAPVVTLHVRERGYLPSANYHRFRDANVENFLPSIEYLLNEGFYIVRIGDSSMKRLGDMPKGFVDAPFHESYEQFVEPYFMGTAAFHVGMMSGASAIALTFGTPVLFTNTQLAVFEWGNPGDLFIPKGFYSERLHRFLTYEEIALSPSVGFCRADEFESNGVRLVENSPVELLRATQEMVAHQRQGFPSTYRSNPIKARAKVIEERANRLRSPLGNAMAFFAPYLSEMELSASYVELNPWFLGHSWLD